MDFHDYIVTFLKCHTNNKSESVLNAFMSGVQKYGFPCKVRTDHGGENIEVWRTMMNIHNSHACVITGSSTHNERIERLWRDVHRSVIVTFADSFRELEAEQVLDSLNEVGVYYLHSVYVAIVNQSLKSFTEAWNNHTISTEQNRTPEQLFL